MMKKSIKNSFAILFLAYFILAGGGYNVVNYCCQTCANEGIEAIATSSCDEVHHHFHTNIILHEHDDIACTDINHNPMGCHLLRLSIDTAPVLTTHTLSFYSTNTIDLIYNTVDLLNKNLLSDYQSIIHPPNGYIHSSGREIITYHAVLII